MGDFILSFENVYISYSKSGRDICKDISFDLKRGTILGVVGESGSGKSTLAKAIVGLLQAKSGKLVRGARNVQMVFQDPASSLNPAHKIGWLLNEALVIKGEKDKAVRDKKIIDIIEKVELEKVCIDRKASELSGGQKQRAAIALALINEPDLIVCDEPISAIDVTRSAEITKLFLKLKKELGLSIIFISHDLRVVYQICDKVLLLRDGEIVEQGDTREVYLHPKSDYMKELCSLYDEGR